ncbi:MAG: hypothetical protein ACTHJQ_22660 [Rhizobiaceae bacterium]
MTTLPFAEWRPDAAGLNSNFTADVMNVLCSTAGYIPFPQLAVFSAAMADRPTGGFTATDNDGTKYIFAGTATKLYLLNNTDLSWTDVSQTGVTYGSTDTERWRFAQYGQYVVAVNANNNPQVYQLGVDTAFADLGGSPPKARFVAVCGDFLFLSGLTDHPNRVQWSALNDITGWTPGTNSSDFQDFAYGEAVMGVTPATNPIIVHKHAVTYGTFVPGSDVVFTFQKVMDQRGAAAPYSICTRGQRTFFADAGGFYMIGADGTDTPIGKEKVDRTVFQTIDGATLYDIIGEIDPFYSRVYFALRYQSTTTAFDRLIIYDWDLQRWTQVGGNLSILFPLASGTIGYTLDNLTDLTGYSLDDLPFSLDSQVWQGGAPVMAAFNSDNKLCFFAGDPEEANITTQETGNTDGTLSYIDGASIIADTNNVHLTIGTRMRRGDSVFYGMERGPTPASDRIDFRSCSRFHIFKMRIDAGSSWSFCQGLDVAPRKAGRR